MLCSHCKKNQETITIAGKTYCANCSTILAEKNIPAEDLPKHKMPKIETTDNSIRTEQVENPPKQEDPAIRELSQNTKIADVSKDDLEGSAILLDILSDDAKDSADKRTLETDKKLEEASEEILDLLGKQQKPPAQKTAPTQNKKGTGTMNDIAPPKEIGRRKDYLNQKHKSIVKEAEKEIKDEVQNAARIISSEKGYTKEYDIMILSIALTAVAMIILAIFMTFR